MIYLLLKDCIENYDYSNLSFVAHTDFDYILDFDYIHMDYGFDFDYSSKTFSTTWGVDEDGDFSESALEDEMIFTNDEEMIVYMANCLVVKLKDKL